LSAAARASGPDHYEPSSFREGVGEGARELVHILKSTLLLYIHTHIPTQTHTPGRGPGSWHILFSRVLPYSQ
jgi:hypothetical protein